MTGIIHQLHPQVVLASITPAQDSLNRFIRLSQGMYDLMLTGRVCRISKSTGMDKRALDKMDDKACGTAYIRCLDITRISTYNEPNSKSYL
jgi:hypothetical protein